MAKKFFISECNGRAEFLTIRGAGWKIRKFNTLENAVNFLKHHYHIKPDQESGEYYTMEITPANSDDVVCWVSFTDHFEHTYNHRIYSF